MYYLEKKKFKKIVRKTNHELFSGFSYFKRIFNRDSILRYREHNFDYSFVEVDWCDLGNKSKYKEAENKIKEYYKERGISRTFKMKRMIRMKVIQNALSEALGYENYQDYISRLKSGELINKKSVNEFDCNEAKAFVHSFGNILDKHFQFETKSVFHGFSLINFVNKKHQQLLKGEYSSIKEIENLMGSAWYASITPYGDDWDFSLDNISNIKEKFTFNYQGDIYEPSNYLEYFEFEKEDENGNVYDFSFMKDLKYVYELLNKEKEIKDLSEKEFLVFRKEAEGAFVDIPLYIIDLIRQDKMDDLFILYLKEINK